MKIRNLFGKAAYFAVVALVAAASCKEEDRLTLADTQDITEEAVTDSYFQDTDDMASVAIAEPTDDTYSGGRTATTITINDDRFKCAGVVVTITPDAASTKTTPKGVITVDFGTTGCSDGRGNIRTGKLLFAYNGWRFIPGSTVVTTTENYTINGVKLTGVRTLTNVSGSTADAPKFRVQLADGEATFSDGTTATRESDITWSWIRTASPLTDYLLIDQVSTANGTTRGGRTYSVSLSKPLKYQRFCSIAVEGIKRYVLDGSKEIVIDYGNGTCDKALTITVNGVTRNLTVD